MRVGRCRAIWRISSVGRASALQAEGHRFEPCILHFFIYADMAELADAQDLGSCVPCGVEVRILLSAYLAYGQANNL